MEGNTFQTNASEHFVITASRHLEGFSILLCLHLWVFLTAHWFPSSPTGDSPTMVLCGLFLRHILFFFPYRQVKWNHSRKNWLPLHRAACSCFFHPLSTAMMWPSRVSTAAICQSKMFSPCLKALLLPQAGLGPQTAVSPTHTALPAKLVVWLPPNPQQQLLFSFSDNWSRQFTLIKHEKAKFLTVYFSAIVMAWRERT